MTLAVTAPFSLDVLTYNARLWGQTVFVHDRPTAVYCDDHRRAALMQERFRDLTHSGTPARPLPDLAGLTEFWDERLLPVFLETGPWSAHQPVCGPFGNGFSDLFPVVRSKNPALHYLITRHPDVIVRYFARSQLLEGARSVHRPASRLLNAIDRRVLEPIKEALERMIEGRACLGSGLVLLSRHRILESSFVPFTSETYGLDTYARKGVLRVTVELPDASRLSVFLTHLHVGNSEAERAARRRQILALAALIRAAPHPVILLSDLNIVAEERDEAGRLVPTREYAWALEEIGLSDSFRDVHPHPDREEESRGYTYDDTTHFSRALGIESGPESPQSLQRLDFIFRDRRLRTVASRVLRAAMRHGDYGGRDLSDHFPLLSTIGS